MTFNDDIAIYDLPLTCNNKKCDLSYYGGALYWLCPNSDYDKLYRINPSNGGVIEIITLDWNNKTSGIAVAGTDNIWIASEGYFVKFNSSGTKLHQSAALLSMQSLCYDSSVNKFITFNLSSPFGLYYYTVLPEGITKKCDSPLGNDPADWATFTCDHNGSSTLICWKANPSGNFGQRFYNSNCSLINGIINGYPGTTNTSGAAYDTATGYLWVIDYDNDKIFAKDCSCMLPEEGGNSALQLFAKILNG